MAYDESIKAKVRATYESENLSFRKVHEMFSSEIPSHKTIESWAKADKERGLGWVKNRYSNLDEAIDSVVEQSISELKDNASKALKQELKRGGVVPLELVENSSYIDSLGEQQVKKALTKKSYMDMMDENLLEAHVLAKNSMNIGTKATFQMMIKSVVETKYGKNINLNNSNSSDIIDIGTMEGKTEAELLEMLNDLQDK